APHPDKPDQHTDQDRGDDAENLSNHRHTHQAKTWGIIMHWLTIQDAFLDDFAPLQPARIDWQDTTPVARDFDDPYFSRDDGPAETTHVFLHGNQLPERFAALPPRARFVIAETGFGTGLN